MAKAGIWRQSAAAFGNGVSAGNQAMASWRKNGGSGIAIVFIGWRKLLAAAQPQALSVGGEKRHHRRRSKSAMLAQHGGGSGGWRHRKKISLGSLAKSSVMANGCWRRAAWR
jgi:hypothetical protein